MSGRRPADFDNWPTIFTVRYEYRAVIKNWVDADTVDCLCDFGLNSYGYEAVRLEGIDAPEIYGHKEPGELERGQAARDYAIEIAPPGTPVQLTTFKDRRSFNRYIGKILLPDGTDLATRLVEAGHAEWSAP